MKEKKSRMSCNVHFYIKKIPLNSQSWCPLRYFIIHSLNYYSKMITWHKMIKCRVHYIGYSSRKRFITKLCMSFLDLLPTHNKKKNPYVCIRKPFYGAPNVFRFCVAWPLEISKSAGYKLIAKLQHAVPNPIHTTKTLKNG